MEMTKKQTIHEFDTTTVTVLDLFAIHAPEVPPWFKPEFKPGPEPPDFGIPEWTEKNSLRWQDITEYSGCLILNRIPEHLQAEAQKQNEDYLKFKNEYDQWSVDYEKAKLLQWPYAWAYEQLLQRCDVAPQP